MAPRVIHMLNATGTSNCGKAATLSIYDVAFMLTFLRQRMLIPNHTCDDCYNIHVLLTLKESLL
jgi:hypothetical protein